MTSQRKHFILLAALYKMKDKKTRNLSNVTFLDDLGIDCITESHDEHPGIVESIDTSGVRLR